MQDIFAQARTRPRIQCTNTSQVHATKWYIVYKRRNQNNCLQDTFARACIRPKGAASAPIWYILYSTKIQLNKARKNVVCKINFCIQDTLSSRARLAECVVRAKVSCIQDTFACARATILYTRYPIVARAWPSARASKGILHTSDDRVSCIQAKTQDL